MLFNNEWKDYEVIATGDGEKLERWGKFVLIRPDPQVIWRAKFPLKSYKGITAAYERSDKGGGHWKHFSSMPEDFLVGWRDLKFKLKLMGFKHTGLFPEQAVNWARMIDVINLENDLRKAKIDVKKCPKNTEKTPKIAQKTAEKPLKNDEKAGKNDANKSAAYEKVSVLNLFAYTGGATLACLSAGAEVTHVDSAKAMVERASENIRLSKLENETCRYIIDDCIKFVKREAKRGKKYDAVIMDPPSFGRGPNGEMWKIEEQIYDLVALTGEVLKSDPLFYLINSYTTGLQPTVMANIMQRTLGLKAVTADEIGLPTSEGIVLPAGASAFYSKHKI